MMKRNDGFTLLELIVSIAVGTIVTAAALSVLLFGMRINNKTTDSVKQLNATNMLTQLVQTVAEEPNVGILENKIVLLDIEKNAKNGTETITIKQVLVEKNDSNILLNGTVFMEGVSDFTANWNDKLLFIEIKTENGTTYSTSVCYRFPIKEVPNES